MKHTYQITGMTCSGCRNHVEQTLKEVQGISDVSVDLEQQEATVYMKEHVSIETLKEALKNDGGRYDIHLPGTYKKESKPMPEIKKRDRGERGKYYCPMLCEGDKKYDKPGDCPKCGMDLEKEKSVSETVEYTCPMHPEVVQSGPGSCPKCGMDLEPRKTTGNDEQEEFRAYKVMLNKFWVSVIFTLPVLFIAMSEMVGISLSGIASHKTWGWVQFVLSTPVIFYACRSFFIRGFKSIIHRSPNMWTLITLGAGSAYIFSIVALLFPEIFPDQFKSEDAASK